MNSRYILLTKCHELIIKRHKRILQDILFALALTTCTFMNITVSHHIECESKDFHNIVELARKEEDEEKNTQFLYTNMDRKNQIRSF